jgi:hypothetical protein
MKRVATLQGIACVFLAAITSGCSSRGVPTPPVNYSLDGAARPEASPTGASQVSGDLNAATDDERDHVIKLQHDRLKAQQDEVDDLRRQKFQDGYYRSRYPSNKQ